MTANPTDKPLDTVEPISIAFVNAIREMNDVIGEEWADAPESDREEIRTLIRAALAADPLRQKLGDTAIQAIMEGKAAVVPITADGRGSVSINDAHVLQPGDFNVVECRKCDLMTIRLDKPTSEDA